MFHDFAAAINNIVFSPPWLNIPLLLQESADATCTLTRDPPLLRPLLLHANFVAIKEIIFDFVGESYRVSAVGVRRYNRHATNYYCVPNFIESHYHSPGLTLDIFLFPATT